MEYREAVFGFRFRRSAYRSNSSANVIGVGVMAVASFIVTVH
jgi:hypothetical protein